jgi:hypothetical protein
VTGRVELQAVLRAAPPGALLGSHLDAPAEEPRGAYAFDVAGWALARSGAPERVEVRRAGGGVVAAAEAGRPRPDIGELHPDVPGADACGFRVLVDALGLPAVFGADVVAVWPDGAEVAVGRLEGRRAPLPAAPDGTLSPVLLTTAGGSGSTWLMHLLAGHPELVTYRPGTFEPRPLAYWLSVALALGRARSYGQILGPGLGEEPWWLGARPPAAPLGLAGEEVLAELGGAAVDALVRFAVERVEGAYRAAAREAGLAAPRAFVEKTTPGSLLHGVVPQLYPAAREIVLVRDLREEAAEQDLEAVERSARGLLAHWRTRGDAALLVRLEDLVLHPGETLTALLEHLGVDAGPAALDAVLARRDHAPPDPAPAGPGAHDLPPRSAEVLAPLLTALGYEV